MRSAAARPMVIRRRRLHFAGAAIAAVAVVLVKVAGVVVERVEAVKAIRWVSGLLVLWRGWV